MDDNELRDGWRDFVKKDNEKIAEEIMEAKLIDRLVEYIFKKTQEGLLKDDLKLCEAMAILERRKAELVGWDTEDEEEEDDDEKGRGKSG